MLAIFRDLGLEQYVAKDTVPLGSVDLDQPIVDEKKEQKKWSERDTKTRARIELAISDAEMVHVMGAETARQMWEQLTTVKESKGQLGILAARRALYRASAEEGSDMAAHIAKLRQMQEELHVMGNKVPDEDFVMILITSLPESWDNYTTSFLGSSSNKPQLKSQELVGILIEEARHRKERDGGAVVAMQAKGKSRDTSDKECYNCHKKGHLRSECWAKGGAKEGQGPKGRKGKNRSNQARAKEAEALNNISYMVSNNNEISAYTWVLDLATTSHICNIRDAFVNFYPTPDTEVLGIGSPAISKGRGTVNLMFTTGTNRTPCQHQLTDALYMPSAPNCLVAVNRIDDSGGEVVFGKS